MSITGGRKLLVTMTGILTSFALAWAGKLTGEYVTVISVTVGAFAAANTLGDHRAAKAGLTKEDVEQSVDATIRKYTRQPGATP
jgi:hypothetical protein